MLFRSSPVAPVSVTTEAAFGSQTRTVLSLLPEARRLPSGEKLSARISPSCPRRRSATPRCFASTTTGATRSNTLYVRGLPQPYETSAARWERGYQFSITYNGKFSIWRLDGSADPVVVQNWVVAKDDLGNNLITAVSGAPVTLRVVRVRESP